VYWEPFSVTQVLVPKFVPSQTSPVSMLLFPHTGFATQEELETDLQSEAQVGTPVVPEGQANPFRLVLSQTSLASATPLPQTAGATHPVAMTDLQSAPQTRVPVYPAPKAVAQVWPDRFDLSQASPLSTLPFPQTGTKAQAFPSPTYPVLQVQVLAPGPVETQFAFTSQGLERQVSIGLQTEGVPAHSNPNSFAQTAEQPSPETNPASSQDSPASIFPLPHCDTHRPSLQRAPVGQTTPRHRSSLHWPAWQVKPMGQLTNGVVQRSTQRPDWQANPLWQTTPLQIISVAQVELHPSPSTTFPSSHSSPPSNLPLPQI
jgi:hypothetical protein